MKTLMAEIERVLPDGGTWCDLEKATVLAGLIVGLKPKLVVEIGVWQGGSLVPMLLAIKRNQLTSMIGRAIAIDPWSASISIIGESQTNATWWSNVDHDAALRIFLGRMEVLGLTKLCEVWRQPSDSCTPPTQIDLLHIDGSHTDQAIRDVSRYAPNVLAGGILVLDDLNWSSGSVQLAHDLAVTLGFGDLCPLGTGVVMQRRFVTEGPAQ